MFNINKVNFKNPNNMVV